MILQELCSTCWMQYSWMVGAGGCGWAQWCQSRTFLEDFSHSSWWPTASLLIILHKGIIVSFTGNCNDFMILLKCLGLVFMIKKSWNIFVFRERMIRLGVVSLCWSISQPISYPLGSWLFDSGGYVCVFYVRTYVHSFVSTNFIGL